MQTNPAVENGGNDLVKSQVLSSEWKTERVREDASGDREDGKEDDDDMPCVIGESEGDCDSIFIRLDRVPACDGLTDGRTNGQADGIAVGITAVCIASNAAAL